MKPEIKRKMLGLGSTNQRDQASFLSAPGNYVQCPLRLPNKNVAEEGEVFALR